MIQDLIAQLEQGKDLTRDQALAGVECLVEESISPETKADFLSALAKKGETLDEISTIASFLRDKAIRPPGIESLEGEDIIDVCGTGGDHLNTFNVSTTVALLLAAEGIKVAKHGNRAITSRSGSADVLMALGIPVDLTPEQAVQSLKDNNFAFFFAIHYHPVFKHIGPARKICAERGQRTIFNFLGPLLNPARPTCQLIGVALPDRCEIMAEVLRSLGIRRGMVASGKVDGTRFMDEFSICGDTRITEFYQDRGVSSSDFEISHLPLDANVIEDLEGGDAEHNAGIIESILNGETRGAKRDVVLLNTAAALLVADRAASITEGWDKAAAIIDSGKATQFLKSLRAWKPS